MTIMTPIRADASISPASLAATEALGSAKPRILFDMTPIIHPQAGVPNPTSRTFWSAVANAHYIVRRDGEDLFGPTPGFARKLDGCADLIAFGRRGPIGCDADHLAGMALWEAADRAGQRECSQYPVAFHTLSHGCQSSSTKPDGAILRSNISIPRSSRTE